MLLVGNHTFTISDTDDSSLNSDIMLEPFSSAMVQCMPGQYFCIFPYKYVCLETFCQLRAH